MIKKLGLLVSMYVLTVTVFAQSGPSIGLFATPEAHMPVGPHAYRYTPGVGARIEGLVGLPATSHIIPSVDIGYVLLPIDLGESGFIASSNMTFLRGGIGMNLSYPLNEQFSVFSRGHISGYYAALVGENTGSASGVAYGGGGGMSLQISPKLNFAFGVNYDSYQDLYDGLSFSIGSTIRLTGSGNSSIPRANYFAPGKLGPRGDLHGYVRFTEVELDRVFPVLYKYYDDHPMGKAVVVNEGTKVLEDIEIRLSLKQFMDSPKVSARIERLEPGQKQEIDIYALFTEEILAVTEGAKIAAELDADYRISAHSGADAEVFTLETYDRNALKWDDDKKIAAFVTARDEEVQRFARNNASLVEDFEVAAVSRELQLAMVLFNALEAHRCTYVVDPSSAFAEMSQDSDAIDTVQFPRQTLRYRAGDCDDLSATYAALLEAVGVPTAFITVPGHIFIAFKLDLSRRNAIRTFSRPDDLIIDSNGAVWVPVETTLLKAGFLAAWAKGSAQWRTHKSDEKAEFIPTADAWKIYEPVAFGVSDYQVDLPLREKVAEGFTAEFNRFVRREITEREQDLLGKLNSRPSDVRLLNTLGVLYARYGLYTQAEPQFKKALRSSDYLPAVINMANIAFIKQDYRGASAAYQRALRIDSDNKAALLGIAMVAYAQDDYRTADSTYTELKQIDPKLAEGYTYLSAGRSGERRASDARGPYSALLWEEGE